MSGEWRSTEEMLGLVRARAAARLARARRRLAVALVVPVVLALVAGGVVLARVGDDGSAAVRVATQPGSVAVTTTLAVPPSSTADAPTVSLFPTPMFPTTSSTVSSTSTSTPLAVPATTSTTAVPHCDSPSLDVTLVSEKASYVVGERVRVVFTVVNRTGRACAEPELGAGTIRWQSAAGDDVGNQTTVVDCRGPGLPCGPVLADGQSNNTPFCWDQHSLESRTQVPPGAYRAIVPWYGKSLSAAFTIVAAIPASTTTLGGYQCQ